MSTQEIGALIDSVNEMTQTVANKNAEIDKKVDEATSAVPETIKKHMNVLVYVDAVNGSDNNDGTLGSQFKTIQTAVEFAPPNSVVNVILKRGQTHVIAGRVQCVNKIVVFQPDGYDSNHPLISVSSYVEDGKLVCGSLDSPREVNLYYVDLRIDDCLDTTTPVHSYGQGLIRNGDKPIHVQFSMAVGSLSHAGHPVMFSGGKPSLVNASLFSVAYERRPSIRSDRKAFDCYGGSMFITSVSFINGTHSDLIGVVKDQFGSVMNVTSNYDFT